MKIAYTTFFDARDVHYWSGTPYHMSQAFIESGASVDYIGPLKRDLPPFFKLKQTLKQYLAGQRESPRFNVHVAKSYARQVESQLKLLSVDTIVAPLINPIAYLDCKQPIVLWTDSLYAQLIGFYPPFSTHSASTIAQGNEMTNECLARSKLAIFCSDWAANSALEIYGTAREKVKVVPFGANIKYHPNSTEIHDIIKHRAKDKIKLLFLAKSWERKGGDVVLAVASALHQAGHPVELTIVGYTPPNLDQTATPYVKCLGFISKNTEEGKRKIQELLAETHFLFVPSRAEAYGIVFCEANAFGVPCLTTYVGGIGTIVKDNINGMTFALDAPVSRYCDYIVNLMNNRKRYEELALSSYNEYETRLNWKVAINTVKGLIAEL